MFDNGCKRRLINRLAAFLMPSYKSMTTKMTTIRPEKWLFGVFVE